MYNGEFYFFNWKSILSNFLSYCAVLLCLRAIVYLIVAAAMCDTTELYISVLTILIMKTPIFESYFLLQAIK